MTTGLKEAILEFFSWESLGAGSDAGQARPGFYAGQLGPHSHWQKKACCSLPPREDWNFFPGKNPDLGLGRAPMPGRRGREAMPSRNVAR